ncbi:MAG: peptide chain release factor N(5)-glutamine methyltransferase, partial [Candidatus Cloacimonadaceae bacterium]|nr:peptide chain release factor N(5)-glutamine methyltransferase [Candidatus Cloacimonadaceae bacterium]
MQKHSISHLLSAVQNHFPAVPHHEIKLLLAHILKCSVTELGLLYTSITEAQNRQFHQFLTRLADGIPLQYVLGSTCFYGLELYVNPHVLIPRPETEGLVELALSDCPSGARILDIGCGSGAICIAMKHHRPDLHIQATDISPEALLVAKANALHHSCEITFFLCDLFPPELGSFDLIISNPPYIPRLEYENLQAQVKDHEPATALLAEWNGERDETGILFYRRILTGVKSYSHPGT